MAKKAVAKGELTITDMAKRLDVTEATARGLMRIHKIKRPKGKKSYGWGSKSELEADAKRIEAKRAGETKKAA